MTDRKITITDVEKVAALARLGLSPEDKEKFVRQLNDVLLYMEKLNELDTGGVEPLSHVLPLVNVLREDAVREGIDQADALRCAPEKKDGFFIVPPVIE
ncbi:MAG: Asp-tRNA(Asn)/Glu-tRNA(Gln) amidotransferase subunit GatC [PVC group bacterium]